MSLFLNMYLRLLPLDYVVNQIVKSVDYYDHTKSADCDDKRHQYRRDKGEGFSRNEKPIKSFTPTFFRVHHVSKRRPNHRYSYANQRLITVLDIRYDRLSGYQQYTVGKQQSVIYKGLYDLITERRLRSECAAGIDDIHKRRDNTKKGYRLLDTSKSLVKLCKSYDRAKQGANMER